MRTEGAVINTHVVIGIGKGIVMDREGFLPLFCKEEYHHHRQHPISTYIHGSHAPWPVQKMYARLDAGGPSLILI